MRTKQAGGSQAKPSKAASQLRAVSVALVRERQVRCTARELAAKIVSLQKQREAAEKELAEIHDILAADPDLTAIARRMMRNSVPGKEGGPSDVVISNPNYVSSGDKRKLLMRILQDFRQENPDADGMSFTAIKSVLQSRYQIQTASAGLFFRNELKDLKTTGGNRNKRVSLSGHESQGQKA
jgi:hypothetical protein